MNERDLDMGIDSIHRQAQAWEKAGSDALAKDDYQTAAADFRKAAEKLREAGDFDKSAFDFERAGNALEGEGGLKRKAGDLKGAENAFKGAAANLEAAGADTLKTKSSLRYGDAQRYYGAAGEDRIHAGVFAEVGGDKKGEAAKNYSQGQADFKRAEEAATKAGHNDDAVDYFVKAEKAGKAAEDASAAHNKPKQRR
jgi:tetratricopeptide (TPR) repeat protein